MKIVLDGFGGDNAPQEIVKGAVEALKVFSDLEIIITGKEEAIKEELKALNYTGEKITILNATEVIDCNEQPTVAVRSKKDSSLVVGLDYIKEATENGINDIAGFVSAGSTGSSSSASFAAFSEDPSISLSSLTAS